MSAYFSICLNIAEIHRFLYGEATNPATGDTVTISLPVSQVQYLQLDFTANSGWPAGQASESEIFPGTS